MNRGRFILRATALILLLVSAVALALWLAGWLQPVGPALPGQPQF